MHKYSKDLAPKWWVRNKMYYCEEEKSIKWRWTKLKDFPTSVDMKTVSSLGLSLWSLSFLLTALSSQEILPRDVGLSNLRLDRLNITSWLLVQDSLISIQMMISLFRTALGTTKSIVLYISFSLSPTKIQSSFKPWKTAWALMQRDEEG